MKTEKYPRIITWLQYAAVSVPFFSAIIGMHILKNIWFTQLSYNVLILSVSVFSLILWKRGGLIKTVFFNRPAYRFRGLLWTGGIAGVLASGPVLYYGWDMFALRDISLITELSRYGLFQPYFLLFLICFSTINPVAEELYWRFVLPDRPLYASILFDALFAAYHYAIISLFARPEYCVFAVIVLFASARLWRYMKSTRLDPLFVFVTHILADFSIMSAILLKASA